MGVERENSGGSGVLILRRALHCGFAWFSFVPVALLRRVLFVLLYKFVRIVVFREVEPLSLGVLSVEFDPLAAQLDAHRFARVAAEVGQSLVLLLA